MDKIKPPAAINPVAGKAVEFKLDSKLKQPHFLRKSLITLAICVTVAAILVGASRYMLLELRSTGNQLQAQRDDVLGRYTQAENEKIEIRDFQPKFIELRKRGFIGEEKRLDWIEHIKSIHESRRLLPLTYTVAAQLPFQVDPSLMPEELELRGSKVKLTMDLLHEMDLFYFLQDLKRQAFYTTESCTISRAPEKTQKTAITPNLSAECTLYWLTIGERPTDAATAPNANGQ